MSNIIYQYMGSILHPKLSVLSRKDMVQKVSQVEPFKEARTI